MTPKPDRPFEPMQQEAAAKIDSVLNNLAKDRDELTAETTRVKIDGVQNGISKVRELSDALKSLKALISGR